MAVKFIKPDRDSIQLIAQDMRQADAEEVWASHHHTPIEALQNSMKLPGYSMIVTINDKPCVMLGLVVRDMISGVGVPWLLGTNASLDHKREFINLVPGVISEMLNICSELYNYVHVDNTVSIRWLKRIGFKFELAEPYGIEKELFHKFHMSRF